MYRYLLWHPIKVSPVHILLNKFVSNNVGGLGGRGYFSCIHTFIPVTYKANSPSNNQD